MLRRDLLKALALAPLAAGSARLYATAETGSRMLLVFLRGGYDAANFLVPMKSSFYYESRPSIAVAPAGSNTDAALPLDSEWGLHPAMRDSLFPLYQKRQAAFIPFVGSHDVSRSHFETQDTIELGQDQGRRDYRSGFMNRLAATLAGRGRPVAFTQRLPVAFRGDARIPNVSLRPSRAPAIDPTEQAEITRMYRNTPLYEEVVAGFSTGNAVVKEMVTEMESAGRQAINVRGLEQNMLRMGRLMRDKFNLGFVDVGGWDTHIAQGGAQGLLANRLETLGRGLTAFADEMGTAWSNTVVIVVSEFGRTFRENGNRGTDHGHGTVYWVLGGVVRGGRVAGEQTQLRAGNLHQDRDYPVLNEYRAVLAGIFSRMYGLDSSRLQQIFPGVQPRDLGLV